MTAATEDGTDAPRRPLLTDAIMAAAEHSPERTAVVGGGETWSFRRLVGESHQFARAIAEVSGAADWIGVCGPRTPRTVAAALGCMLAGRVYLPLDPNHPEQRLSLIVDDADAALILFDGAVPDHIADHPRSLTLNALTDASEGGGTCRRAESNDVAYVIYTSGSTGKPKGVLAQHGALAALADAIGDHRPGLDAHDVVLAVASFAFDMSITDVFVPLARGATVVLAPDARDTAGLLDLIDAHGVTTVLATPSLWRTLVSGGLGDDGRRRVRAIGGGERLTGSLAGELLGRTERLYNGYGPTETTVYVTFGEVRDADDITLGRRTPSSLLYVLDGRLGAVPPGGRGELYIGGDTVSLGYHRRPGLTAEKFLPDPYSGRPGARLYRTGDIVRLRGDGELEFIGRSDSQVKIRGHRVEPGEVEAVLAQHPDVREAVVLAVDAPAGETALAAYWVGGETAADGEPASWNRPPRVPDPAPTYSRPASQHCTPEPPAPRQRTGTRSSCSTGSSNS
ncbi:amino acid adenylation domain-containing protein [Spinactinospora alkalitolerans]|uniref:Amino acid adenylation domain-containing protein n=1 Tax=Spinactinospora alkalitolerans TaxID=687207 RepID=A0A852TWS6_9ACTN|nr:amino acid adenylation domain-containing protein [Spinactinospora alkalitolerans]NYE48469.1 amino acid adenylation domain-containing protein [Spinactinospora alkalitolerans]